MRDIRGIKRYFLQWQLKKLNKNHYLSGNDDNNKNYNIYKNLFGESDKRFLLTISTATAMIIQDIYFDKIDEILEVVKGIRFQLEEELL